MRDGHYSYSLWSLLLTELAMIVEFASVNHDGWTLFAPSIREWFDYFHSGVPINPGPISFKALYRAIVGRVFFFTGSPNALMFLIQSD